MGLSAASPPSRETPEPGTDGGSGSDGRDDSVACVGMMRAAEPSAVDPSPARDGPREGGRVGTESELRRHRARRRADSTRRQGALATWRNEIVVGLLVGSILTFVQIYSDADNAARQNELAATQNSKAEVLENTRFVRQVAMSRDTVRPFQGLNLKGAVLTGLPLWCDIQREVTACSNFEGANLDAAVLTDTSLDGARLTDASLVDADLSGVRMQYADFTRAKLNGADLSGASLQGSSFVNTVLDHTNLVGANLEGANFTGADMMVTNLSCADLRGADLVGVDMTGAVVNDLTNQSFTACTAGEESTTVDLTGANLAGSNLSGLDLSNALMGNVRWVETNPWLDEVLSQDSASVAANPSQGTEAAVSNVIVGAPCFKDTKWPAGFVPPVEMDCSKWTPDYPPHSFSRGSLPSLMSGNNLRARILGDREGADWLREGIEVRRGDRLLVGYSLHSTGNVVPAATVSVDIPSGQSSSLRLTARAVSGQTWPDRTVTHLRVESETGDPLRLSPVAGSVRAVTHYGDQGDCAPEQTIELSDRLFHEGTGVGPIGLVRRDDLCSEAIVRVEFELEVVR